MSTFTAADEYAQLREQGNSAEEAAKTVDAGFMSFSEWRKHHGKTRRSRRGREMDGDYLFNRALCRDYVCAQCEGRLVEVYDGSWRVVCAADHAHEGKRRKSSVVIRKATEVIEGIELRAAYPDLAPERQSVAQDMADLFG